MMGESFAEEPYIALWLSALDPLGTTKERKVEITQAIVACNFELGSPYQAGYVLPDFRAGAGAYLYSELEGRSWQEFEDASAELLFREYVTAEERDLLAKRTEEMGPISDVGGWQIEHAQGKDFIHFYANAVGVHARGSGAFRQLLTPFFDYAREKGIDCYLECFSDNLESIYTHYGFETIDVKTSPLFDVREICMVKHPE